MTYNKIETSFSGTPISGGVVLGDALIIPQEFRKREMKNGIKNSEIQREIGRVKEALQILILVNEYSEKFLRDYNASSIAESSQKITNISQNLLISALIQ